MTCNAARLPRDEYSSGKAGNEYLRFSEETRWDAELYAAKLADLEE